jgi:hygromycin-B 7''-O-kinase
MISLEGLRVFGRVLHSYGYSGDSELRRRLMGWTLLHVYSNLPKYLRLLPSPEEPTLDAAAERWFAVR